MERCSSRPKSGARRSSLPSRATTKHVVIHQERHGGSPCFHECYMVRSVALLDGPEVIVSRILTGTKPAVDYGSDEPLIKRRVDRLRRRIASGGHFAHGPLGASGPRLGPKAVSRLQSADLRIVGDLYFALAAEPRFKRVQCAADGQNTPAHDVFQSQPGTTSLWKDYIRAHGIRNLQQRKHVLEGIRRKMWALCPMLPQKPGPARRALERSFLCILEDRSSGKSRTPVPFFRSSKRLALALGAETLRVDQKTLSRRVFLHSPWDSSYA